MYLLLSLLSISLTFQPFFLRKLLCFTYLPITWMSLLLFHFLQWSKHVWLVSMPWTSFWTLLSKSLNIMIWKNVWTALTKIRVQETSHFPCKIFAANKMHRNCTERSRERSTHQIPCRVLYNVNVFHPPDFFWENRVETVSIALCGTVKVI
jgi:hypothetical protein